MYQPSASGRASRRSVSAVGEQSTRITSHFPEQRLVAQLEERDHLLGAGEDRELLSGDRVDAGGVENRQQVALDLRPGLLEAPLDVDLLHVQPLLQPRRLRADRLPEGVPEGVGRIRREDERPMAGSGCGGRRTRRRGGLADAALAGEEDDPQRQPSDSTRFFSPFSAVSMMTFSALRFSIPIIGMEMSTARV